MFNKGKSIIILFLWLSLIPSFGLEAGEVAPVFQVKDIQGREVNLASYRGNKVLLYFIKLLDEPTREELFSLKSLVDTKAVKVILIFTRIKEAKLAESLGFTVIYDTKKELVKLYQIKSFFPACFILEEQGKILATRYGFMLPFNKFYEHFISQSTPNYKPLSPNCPWVGALIIKLPKFIKNQFSIKQGVLVGKVFPDSPAFVAGLRGWDIITKVEDKVVKEEGEVVKILSNHKIGDEVNFSIYRFFPQTFSILVNPPLPRQGLTELSSDFLTLYPQAGLLIEKDGIFPNIKCGDLLVKVNETPATKLAVISKINNGTYKKIKLDFLKLTLKPIELNIKLAKKS